MKLVFCPDSRPSCTDAPKKKKIRNYFKVAKIMSEPTCTRGNTDPRYERQNQKRQTWPETGDLGVFTVGKDSKFREIFSPHL
jgi:hypothetical protein